jgi:hypothetical protein
MSTKYSTFDLLHLYIDSRDRTSGSNEEFTLRLVEPLRNVRAVSIVDATIPLTYYEFPAAQILRIDGNGLGWVNLSALAAGNYTSTEMAAALQTSLNTLVPAGYVVTYSAINYKITISRPGVPFDLEAAGSSDKLYSALGFQGDKIAVDTVTSDTIASTHSQAYFYVKSNKLSTNAYSSVKTSNPSDGDNVVAKIKIDQNLGAVVQHSSGGDEAVDFHNLTTLDRIDLALAFHDETVPNLNQQPWQIRLGIYRLVDPLNIHSA